MANQRHLDRLEKGIDAWNSWRRHSPGIPPNLRGANLAGAILTGATLSRAILTGATLYRTDLSRADLTNAILIGADLAEASLSRANLIGANLKRAVLIETDFTEATLNNCRVYGTSVWNVKLQGARQNDLIITPYEEAIITVDTLEVAQFVYLLVNNPTIRQVIDTIARKAVLILGRFSPERKAVLELLKVELRKRDYVPILFDFQKPSSQDLTETVSTLTHLSRFIIADLTDPSCIPHELYAIVPHRMVPVQALFSPSKKTNQPYAMFRDLRQKYHWILPPYWYQTPEELLASLDQQLLRQQNTRHAKS